MNQNLKVWKFWGLTILQKNEKACCEVSNKSVTGPLLNSLWGCMTKNTASFRERGQRQNEMN